MVVGGAAAAESDSEGEGARGRGHAFFQRSDSTLCLGCPPPDPFNSKLFSSILTMIMNCCSLYINVWTGYNIFNIVSDLLNIICKIQL